MANYCYADFDVVAPDAEHADKLEKTLKSMIQKEDNSVTYMELANCLLSYVYMDRTGFNIHIEANVKWGFNDDEVRALLSWFREHGDICEFTLDYEEVASYMYGEYFWGDDEDDPDCILHTYLPANKWPKNPDSDLYFEKIAERFEKYRKDRRIRLKEDKHQ